MITAFALYFDNIKNAIKKSIQLLRAKKTFYDKKLIYNHLAEPCKK